MNPLDLIEKRGKRFQKGCYVLAVLTILFDSYAFITNLMRQNYYLVMHSLLGVGMLILPFILFHFLPIRLPKDALFVYYLFSFMAVVLGNVYEMYAKIPVWDKMLHSASGFLITMIGLMLFYTLTKKDFTKQPELLSVAIVFAESFNIAVAAVWEIYEYLLLVFFNIDAVNFYTTGMNDTMQDMIVCLIGGLITAFFVWLDVKRKKHFFLLNFYRHFLAVNHYQ